MKGLLSLISLFILTGCNVPSSMTDASCSNIAQIYGSWDVALLFDSSQPTSSTKMIMSGNGNNKISGSFYGSSFESAKTTAITGHFIIATATSDGTGEYIHTARYNCANDSFEGQTWSRGRDFLMSWTAERADG